ncbi:MAG: hypothetical protein NTU44_06300 [Bacteroidetes bacterium]|nr:hypothetical protein [Bacteroidota bacterium]
MKRFGLFTFGLLLIFFIGSCSGNKTNDEGWKDTITRKNMDTNAMRKQIPVEKATKTDTTKVPKEIKF